MSLIKEEVVNETKQTVSNQKIPENLAIVEVPFISGKIQLRVLWKSGAWLPLYERKIDDEYALENFHTPLLVKLILIEDE